MALSSSLFEVRHRIVIINMWSEHRKTADEMERDGIDGRFGGQGAVKAMTAASAANGACTLTICTPPILRTCFHRMQMLKMRFGLFLLLFSL